MKKYMIAFILCGLITAIFTGCENKENADISLESMQPETNFTTSVLSTEVTTVKETTETTSKVKQTDTKVPHNTVPIVKETQAPVVNIAPQTKPVIAEQATMDTLQLEQSEFELIKYPERGSCLYRCGNERYLLQVIAPPYKEKLFGSAGGR